MCCRHSLKFIVFFISFSWQRMNHSIDPPYHHVYFNGFSSLQHLYSFLRHGSQGLGQPAMTLPHYQGLRFSLLCVCCFVRALSMLILWDTKEGNFGEQQQVTFKNDKTVFGIFYHRLRKQIIVPNQKSIHIVTFNTF